MITVCIQLHISLSSDVAMVLMRSRMRRELVTSMNAIEFEFFKCHLVNSCVHLYEFGYELEMSLSLRESLRMYSGIVL